jgi:hypothetical protein
MSLRQQDLSRQGARLQVYLDGLTEVAGHADRVVPIENYTKGLMLFRLAKSGKDEALPLRPPLRTGHESFPSSGSSHV